MTSKSRMLPENLSSGNSLVVSLESAANQLFVRSPNAVGKGLYVAKGDAQVSQDERWNLIYKGSNYQIQNAGNSLYAWVHAEALPGTPVTLSESPMDWTLTYDWDIEGYKISPAKSTGSGLMWTVDSSASLPVVLNQDLGEASVFAMDVL